LEDLEVRKSKLEWGGNWIRLLSGLLENLETHVSDTLGCDYEYYSLLRSDAV